MGVAKLGSSRGLIGTFYKTLQQDTGVGWINSISKLFTSNQLTEIYRWLGMVPQMREWIGARQAKGFYDNEYSITNKRFEATLEVLRADAQRDDTGQTRMRIADLARRTNSHWAKLLTDLIIAGESTTCYDGQYFFDTDHVEGNNTTSQSNDLSIDISALPAEVHGSTANPSSEEMAQVIMKTIEAIIGFKDNENEPMGEEANAFLVMCPISLVSSCSSAIVNPTFGGGATNELYGFSKDMGYSITLAPNARLTWTEQIATFRTDSGGGKALIRQQEKEVELKAKAEGSEFEFDNDAWQFGVDARRNVGYGFWQDACLATMT
jgi:phage major head subunit gpT-like protein